MHKPNQNFKMSQSTKRMMATLDKQSRGEYKKIMTEAQLAEQFNKLRKKKEPTSNEGEE